MNRVPINNPAMDWDAWFKQYEILPSLRTRLRLVREQLVAALDACPPGPIRVVSICAGDGRDLLGALHGHPRRSDVTAALLDNNAESIARGRAAAAAAGLAGQLNFLEADATRAANYAGHVPADVVLLSGFLGHLRHEDVPRLIASLPMFCQPGGQVIWNRHLVLNGGGAQVPAIREDFRRNGFSELEFAAPEPDGFAVARCRFTGESAPLDPARTLFEFVGIDRLMAEAQPPTPAMIISAAANVTKPLPDEYAWGEEQTIGDRFAQMVARHAARTALKSETWSPTYAELDAAANRLAHAVIGGGGAPGERIALLLRHDTPLIAALLAVLKTGRVVVVLNQTDPPARLRQILEDAAPALLVTDAANRELAGEIAGPTLQVTTFEEHSSGPASAPQIKVEPRDLAFLIYTSGSTGRPKAVMQTHRNVVYNARRLSRGMEIRAEDAVTLLASPSGGQGVATTWCALLNGAALCPFPPLERGAAEIADWLPRTGITVVVAAASLFRAFVKTLAAGQQLPEVRLVRLGSESATTEDFAAFQKLFGEACILFLTLSSSETGNITQLRLRRADVVAAGRLPVGFPADGIEVLLLDENGNEVPPGETGEVVARGRYLSPGYWRNESLTAERFTDSDQPETTRLFRSGDLARRDADGLLWFAGRKDSRVKIRGYRVELSEIEEALTRLPEVERAVVVLRPLPDGDTQLIGYVVARDKGVPADALRRALRATLPAYMVPAAFVFLEEFPLTPHGKIDRQALPAPAEPKHAIRRSDKPRDIVEITLVKIWETVLGIAPIGRHDDFFELGGTSLQSIEVLLHIEERLGPLLPPSTLAEYSTIERLAPVLAGHVVFASPSPLVTLRAEGEGRPLFLIHTGQGDVVTYAPLARRLRGPVYGLQSVGLQGESWPLMGVPAMARRYLPEILAKDPTGPYLLGGACMGGLVAWELAQLLRAQGKTVGLLALLDVRYPLPAWQQHEWVEKYYGPFRDPVRDAFRILRWAVARTVGLGRSARWLPAYRRFVAHMNSRANRTYRPQFYPETLTLFLTAETKFPRADLRLMLRRHAQTTQLITVPGLRSGLLLKPVVDEVAEKLQACMDAVKTA